MCTWWVLNTKTLVWTTYINTHPKQKGKRKWTKTISFIWVHPWLNCLACCGFTWAIQCWCRTLGMQSLCDWKTRCIIAQVWHCKLMSKTSLMMLNEGIYKINTEQYMEHPVIDHKSACPHGRYWEICKEWSYNKIPKVPKWQHSNQKGMRPPRAPASDWDLDGALSFQS